MSKNSKLGYLALAISFIVVSVIGFFVPTEKNSVFWIGYAFTVVAFALQILIWNLAFGKSENMKSKFLGLPLIQLGITYLTIQVIAFAVFIYFADRLQPWVPIIVCLPILGIVTIGLIGAEVGRDEIIRVESNVKRKTLALKTAQIDVESMANNEADAQTEIELRKLAEIIKYSDPMSSDELEPLELLISEKIELMKGTSEKSALIKEVQQLFAERNAKCKSIK